jgi:hypothetical protein
MQPGDARRVWHLIETIHAVTYFAEESREAARRLGLEGFWMGYFAFRAAPMGPVLPAVVTSTFFNFHPARVDRALPDAWRLVGDVEVIVAARRAAAAGSVRRLVPAVEAVAEEVDALLGRVVGAADAAGRPLFGANQALATAEDPVERLWQSCTSLREHRGDGHVACLTAEGLDGCQVHVLFAAGEGADPTLYRDSRGWSLEDWDDAADRLRRRGLLEREGLSDAGRDLRARIERRTDELAIDPYHALSNVELDQLLATLNPVARTIGASGTVRYPNPMGLPRLAAGEP